MAARVEQLAGFVMENTPFRKAGPIAAPIVTAVLSHFRTGARSNCYTSAVLGSMKATTAAGYCMAHRTHCENIGYERNSVTTRPCV